MRLPAAEAGEVLERKIAVVLAEGEEAGEVRHRDFLVGLLVSKEELQVEAAVEVQPEKLRDRHSVRLSRLESHRLVVEVDAERVPEEGIVPKGLEVVEEHSRTAEVVVKLEVRGLRK